jgi:pimeloyl-ACP methyl ester carboxylesterase
VRAVWLHGAGLSAGTWDAARIGDGLALDLPGHAGRPRAPEPDVESFAAEVLRDCPERFDLVGHSLGAMVGIVIAALHPGRVRRLVLAEAVIGSGSATLRWQGSIIARGVVRLLGPAAVARLFSLGAQGETRRALRRDLASMTRGGLRDALNAATSFDVARYLAAIQAPTLVLAAAENKLTRRQGGRIAGAIGTATFEELPGGHMLHTDCPDAFYPRIAAFLRDGR